MWTRYDPEIVRQELRVLSEHGLNMTRSFFYWPDFHPTPDTLDEQCIANFHDFLDAHESLGMTTVPTFLVGHMSGENWDPVWRGDRDLYSDVWFVGRQAWYVRELTARFASHPAVSGWLLTNEVPIYGGEAPRPIVEAWASLLVNAVRAGGGTQPVSVGDGAWGIETTGHDNGFSNTDLAAFTDFVGPHVYRMESDQIRQHLKAAYIAELCHIAGLPVIMEEFGLTSDFVSPEGAATYYRQLLYNTLLAGATGWIAWNNTDYDDLIDQRPYSHHPFEMHFGITDSTGAPKPPLLELASFASDLAAIDIASVTRSSVDAALVVPSHLAADYPFTQEPERALIVAVGEQAYVAAHEAHLPVAVVRESEDGECRPATASTSSPPSSSSAARPGSSCSRSRREAPPSTPHTAWATSAFSAARGGRTRTSFSASRTTRPTAWSRRCSTLKSSCGSSNRSVRWPPAPSCGSRPRATSTPGRSSPSPLQPAL
ncbi:cellulase family glycosylhydrolase [Leifsonia poae]|uniref:glycoside hydrolase 5 family protein n=1 Tax=Leifsonia poae TaxID=110933 RepID=UPI003D673942